jgi:hypothetical protein
MIVIQEKEFNNNKIEKNMKKILITFVMCFIGYTMFAQVQNLPFVGFKAEPAQTVKKTPPPTNIGYYNPGDPLGLGSRPSQSKPSNVQKEKVNYKGSWYKAIGVQINDGKWEDTNMKILIGDDMLTVFADETHTIRVGEMYDEGRLDENSYYTSYKCVDDKGKKCLLDIITSDDSILLNIEFEKFSVRYGIIPD